MRGGYVLVDFENLLINGDTILPVNIGANLLKAVELGKPLILQNIKIGEGTGIGYTGIIKNMFVNSVIEDSNGDLYFSVIYDDQVIKFTYIVGQNKLNVDIYDL